MDLLPGLPPIDGWTITDPLPNIDQLGQEFIDCAEISQPPSVGHEAGREARERLADIGTGLIGPTAGRLASDSAAHRQPSTSLYLACSAECPGTPWSDWKVLTSTRSQPQSAKSSGLWVTPPSVGRWGDLHRHLYFGQGHDWHDIHEFDWPSVRSDVEGAALFDP